MYKIIFLIISIFFLAFLIGVSVGHYELFPYDFVVDTKQLFFNTNQQNFQSSFEVFEDLNEGLKNISINSTSDIETKRINLYEYIWFTNSIPTKLPDLINYDIENQNFNDLDNLKRIDQFTINMDYGINSIPYLFLSENSNKKLVIYHQGHAEKTFSEDKKLIQTFLNQGYSVLVFSMILHGDNHQPVVELENIGKLKLTTHNHLKFLESSSLHSLKFFVEPISISLNLMEQQYDFDSYNMIGLSGGGWTTTIYSALDPRISKSFSIAGSLPVFLRSDIKNLGDYEQTIPEFLKIANYIELYLMSSYGENRSAVQVFIKSDPCCFPSELYEKYPYERLILEKLDLLGSGEFDVIIDGSTDKHEISEAILEKILQELII